MSQTVRILNKYDGTSLRSFIIALPVPELKDYIEVYFGQEFHVPSYPGKFMPRLLLLPKGGIMMSICYQDTSYLVQSGRRKFHFNTLVMGMHNVQTPYFIDDCPPVNKQIFVVFKPGGFYRFFDICDGEMRNDCFKMDEVIGGTMRQIESQMDDSLSMEERVRIIDQFLLKRFYGKRGIMSNDDTANAVKSIIAKRGNVKVHEISKEFGISGRTLERQFKERIGLSPKEFSNIVRFEHVLKNISSMDSSARPKLDWHDLVESYGYYDQSHLIDEFKAATTFTPEAYLEQKGTGVIKFTHGLIFSGDLNTQHDSYRRAMREADESQRKVNIGA